MISSRDGHVVWCNGPYPCGSFPDLESFDSVHKNQILPEQKIIAHERYKGAMFIGKLNLSADAREYHRLVRARHETFHKQTAEVFQYFENDVPGSFRETFSLLLCSRKHRKHLDEVFFASFSYSVIEISSSRNEYQRYKLF